MDTGQFIDYSRLAVHRRTNGQGAKHSLGHAFCYGGPCPAIQLLGLRQGGKDHRTELVRSNQ